MDAVPDMDDLLNELEAAETTERLKYGMNDPVLNPKVVLLDSSNDFNDKQNTTRILHGDHIGTSIIVGKFHSIIKVLEKYYNNAGIWRNASNCI